MFYVNQVIILQCGLPSCLGKKRIYLETQLKGEFTDLF